jgi:cyclic pyranopterin phosphate synthase
MKENKLTHVNEAGKIYMVDVGEKSDTRRFAKAKGKVYAKKTTIDLIKQNKSKKGDVITVADIAGIMGGKKTAELIPLCHQIPIHSIDLEFEIFDDGIEVFAKAFTTGKTGIEMEALTAVSIACLTIYDMCKAVDKEMVIGDICLLEKSGGASGDFRRE